MSKSTDYDCAVLAALDLLGKKWIPLILTELMNAMELHFSELKNEIYDKYSKKISARVLSDALTLLEEEEIIKRTVISKRPKRVIYYLTPKGEDLIPIFAALKSWNIKWHTPKYQKCQAASCIHDKVPTIDFEKLQEFLSTSN